MSTIYFLLGFLYSLTVIGQEKAVLPDTSQYKFIRQRIKDEDFFIQLDKNDKDALFRRAELKFKIEDWNGAIHDYKELIRLDSNNYYPYYMIGCCYERTGEYHIGIQFMSKSIAKHPKNEWAYNDRGLLYLRTNKNDLAIQDFNTALQLKPEWSVALFGLGNAFDKVNKISESIIFYQRAIKADSTNYKALNNLGFIYFEQNKLQAAIEYFSLAINIKPNYVKALTNRADAYLKLRELNLACKDIEQAIIYGRSDLLETKQKICK
ncbi:MAG: tetratricopeptide repeat protein [Cytophagaceae bacterium]